MTTRSVSQQAAARRTLDTLAAAKNRPDRYRIACQTLAAVCDETPLRVAFLVDLYRMNPDAAVDELAQLFSDALR